MHVFRTYRERRDQYLKILESQLHRYQAENAQLVSDGEELRSKVFALQRKVDQYETDERHESPSEAHQRNAIVGKPDPHDQSAYLRLEKLDGKAQRMVISSSSSQRTTFTDFNSPTLARRQVSRPKYSQPLHSQLVANMDIVVVAVEFVLKLVSVLLNAPRLTSSDSNLPACHTSMTLPTTPISRLRATCTPYRLPFSHPCQDQAKQPR